MRTALLAAFILLFYASHAAAQCAPGIPSAGNPGCIPPNQPNSPYYNANDAAVAAPEPDWQWSDRWGAIAIDEGTAAAGTVEGQTSKSEATSEVLRQCESLGGTNCKVIMVFVNQCAAASQSQIDGRVFTVSRKTKQESEDGAIANCGGRNSCKIVYSQCSPPVRVRAR
ncbi:DUF4189 domain-containing protein [Luteibacter sp. Lutesp34]|uniref:DUF4189 domain-containing protein n=1 Tax=Luteibacter sp. Lutesp34 TaxID=3243030 RepID=UPI0039B37940